MSKKLILTALALAAFFLPAINVQADPLDSQESALKAKMVAIMKQVDKLPAGEKEPIVEQLTAINKANYEAMQVDIDCQVPKEQRKVNEIARLATEVSIAEGLLNGAPPAPQL